MSSVEKGMLLSLELFELNEGVGVGVANFSSCGCDPLVNGSCAKCIVYMVKGLGCTWDDGV